ncbi:MAG: HU family DNA-binding protein [Rikenellaceae bacterium]
MNKPELIDKLRKRIIEERRITYPKQDLDAIISPMVDIMMEELNSGGKIHIQNFGVFEVKAQQPRKFYNIQTGLHEFSKPKRVVEFKPSRKFRSKK